MREYALIMMSMINYAGTYLKKNSAEYARILHATDAAHK